MSRLEYNLLRRGTFDGPVSEEIVALAKKMYQDVRIKCKHEERKDGWSDWIPEARKRLGSPVWEDLPLDKCPRWVRLYRKHEGAKK